MTVNNDCTVYVTPLKDGGVDVSWKRNHPITDEESLEALEDYKVILKDESESHYTL